MLAFLTAIPISQPILLALATTLTVYLFDSDNRPTVPAA